MNRISEDKVVGGLILGAIVGCGAASIANHYVKDVSFVSGIGLISGVIGALVIILCMKLVQR